MKLLARKYQKNVLPLGMNKPKKRIHCPWHPEADLVRTDLPGGKVNLRCPDCTEERRASIRIVVSDVTPIKHKAGA